MKRIRIASLLAALVVFTMSLTATVSAEGEDSVFVTISNGSLVLAYEEVTLTDADGDGALTVNDALIGAHDKSFEGGADAGYGSAATEYGLSMTKLWGAADANGGFGYCVNNAPAMSLADAVKAGDHIAAYVYTDKSSFSDAYSYFDTLTSASGETVLTLSKSGYDAEWNPTTSPVVGAEITVDGVRTGIKTDENGKATVTVEGEGRHVVSAVSDTETLVPPVCIVTLEASGEKQPAPPTGNGAFALILTAVLAAAVTVTVSRRRANG